MRSHFISRMKIETPVNLDYSTQNNTHYDAKNFCYKPYSTFYL